MAPQNSILIIESDHDTRVKVRNALENEGYLVRSVTNVTTAFEKLKKYATISLVIYGMTLPFTESSEFLGTKSADPLLESIPVVIITDTDEKASKPVVG